MSFADTSIHILPKLYGVANRFGLFNNNLARFVFRFLYFRYKLYIEDPFAKLVKNYPGLLQGGNVIDIGANIGYTARLFSHYLDRDCKVYAFEPDPLNFDELTKNVDAQKVVARQYAIGAEEGVVDFWYNSGHHADHRVVTPELRNKLGTEEKINRVAQTSIDHFLEQNQINGPIRFVKIDVQGFELPVCYGIEKTIESNPEIIFAVEYYPQVMREMGYVAEDLLEFFSSRGFKLYYFDRHSKPVLFSIEGLDEKLGRKAYFDFLAVKGDFSFS